MIPLRVRGRRGCDWTEDQDGRERVIVVARVADVLEGQMTFAAAHRPLQRGAEEVRLMSADSDRGGVGCTVDAAGWRGIREAAVAGPAPALERTELFLLRVAAGACDSEQHRHDPT